MTEFIHVVKSQIQDFMVTFLVDLVNCIKRRINTHKQYLFNKIPRYIKNAKIENVLKSTLITRHVKLKLSLCQSAPSPSVLLRGVLSLLMGPGPST